MITEEQLHHELTTIRAALSRIENSMPSLVEEELARYISDTATRYPDLIPARHFYRQVQRRGSRCGDRRIAAAMEAMGFSRKKLEAGIFWLKPEHAAAPSGPEPAL